VSDTVRVEVVFDTRCHSELEREAERLGITVSDIVRRAACAWITDVDNDGASATGAVRPTSVAE
jgi:hypothetical protein